MVSSSEAERMICGYLKRQIVVFLVVMLAASLLSTVALALGPKKTSVQYAYDIWTTEDGLPQNSINDILQTSDGYLWLATFGGLVRFDGSRFVVFDRSVEGIKSQRIKALYEDKKGTLWAGTEEGMLIRYRDGEFTTYTLEDRLPSEEAFRIEEDDEGNLWITGRGVVIKFDGERFVSYRRESFAPDAHDTDYYIRYKVWWSEDSAGLHCFVKGRMRTYSLPELSKAKIINVDTDYHGNLWIQTRGAGVVELTNEQRKRYTVREGLPSNDLTGFFLEDRKGNLWLAAHEDHSLYRIKDGKYELVRTFPAFSLAALYEDREGAVWLGTSTGLYRIREAAITLYTEREGLSWNWTYSIFQDRAGAIWIGTWGGGLNKFENGRFTRYQRAEGLPSDNITCTYEDLDGRLWVGANGGVSYFDNGRFKPYDDKNGFLKRDVWAIHQDRAGTLWFGTDTGLVKLRDGNFTEYTTKDGLSHDVIRSLFEDHAGTLWIGTDQGLTRLKDGVFTSYTERNGFIGNQVRAIYEDSEGVLWIGTYDGGLYRFEDERLTRYTTREGLHDNGVFGILEDDGGNLWMSCNRGIYRVSRRELNDFASGMIRSVTSVVYGTKDGLATLECNGGRQPSGLKTKDGRLWFPTMGGVAVIDPEAVQINTQPPPVIIEEFRIDNEAINLSDSMELQPNKDSFEIRYTATSFIKPEYIKFKYMLEGLRNDWVDAGTRRVVNYSYVPPGDYTFIIIAANSDGVWNETGKSIRIRVIPHWWERRWVQGLMILSAVLFLVSAIVFWYKRRVEQLEKEKTMQESLAEQLSKEKAMQEDFSRKLIDSQESERKRIASELHDSLGQNLLVVKNNALLGLNTAEDGSPAEKQFAEISTVTSRALEEVREITHNLRPYHLDRLGLKDALEFMIEKIAASSEIRFSAAIDEMDGIFSKEAEISLYRIVQEGINNIVKHSGAAEAKVTLKRDDRQVRLMIEDNGKGFIADLGTETGPRSRGFGLTGISERARMLGGKETIHSVLGQGTAIFITLMLPDERGEDAGHEA
jgi:signal transduction histidine kinase/ligand-binding sensor domain-containing protein